MVKEYIKGNIHFIVKFLERNSKYGNVKSAVYKNRIISPMNTKSVATLPIKDF